MTGRTTDYRGRRWRVVGPDMAAGYDSDLLGGWTLIGIVVYAPTTEKLRNPRLRDLERAGSAVERALALEQEHPPTPEQLAEAWGRKTHVYTDILQKPVPQVGDELADATRVEELRRRDGEEPDEFYARIARAHRALSDVTRKPTLELAKRAGVKPGTAAAWVSRARARGLLDEEGEQS